MKYTREHLETLKEAIALGVLEIDYGDRRLKYRSLDEMERIVAKIEGELGQRKASKSNIKLEFKDGY